MTPDLDTDLANSIAPESTRSPFSDELVVTDVYRHEAWQLGLNKLLHLAPYSALVLIAGPAGAGKTTLLAQFVDSALDSLRVGVVEIGMLTSRRDLVQQIAQALGVRLDADDHGDDVPQIVVGFLKSMARSGRRAVLLVDNAELLDADKLALLDRLLVESDASLGLVLASEQDDVLTAYPSLAARLNYTLPMPRLDRAGVEAYVRHRLVLQGQEALFGKFNAAALDRMFAASQGLPGAVNAAARDLLAEVTVEKAKPKPRPKPLDIRAERDEPVRPAKPSKSGKKPSPLTIALSVVGVTAVALVLYFQDQINQAFEPLPPAPVTAAEVIATPAGGEEFGRGDIRRQAADAEVVVDEAVAESAPAVETEPEVVTDEVPASDSAAVVAEEEVPVDAPAAEPKVEAPVAQADIVMDEPALIQRTPAPRAEAKPVAKPVARESVVTVPAVDMVAPVLSESLAESLADPLLPLAPSPIIEGEQWLLAQSEERFTLQLMALADEVKVRRLAAQHGLEHERALYIKKRAGDPLVVLVYGSYPDRNLAQQAAQQIPKQWGFGTPWVRSFASVRADLTPK